jgi:hypothetical protein
VAAWTAVAVPADSSRAATPSMIRLIAQSSSIPDKSQQN